jgi:hypothetical protein
MKMGDKCIHEISISGETGYHRCRLFMNPEHTRYETCEIVTLKGECQFQCVGAENRSGVTVGETGVLGSDAEPACPVCGVDRGRGYYGGWGDCRELECCECRSVIEVEPVTEWHFTVKKIGDRK